MFTQLTETKTIEIPSVNFCCGIGGQDLGFSESTYEYKNVKAVFKTIAAFDNDPIACKNFERITGTKASCVDLFSKELYAMFHGHEPDDDWEELTPERLREYCNGIYPQFVFMSPPCKSFSRLLPKKKCNEDKYKALSLLPERIMDLTLEAWFDDLPAVILMENVPGIRDEGRGKETLLRIKSKLASRGYVFHEDLYDCGEWGGLGQHRVRYLLIARLESKLPSFIFQPSKMPLKTIGDILGPIPMPGDTKSCGRLHRLPKLAWKTWERLALIPEGKDWRALENKDDKCKQWAGAWKIVPWEEPSHTVTAATKGVGVSTGVSAVADPRLNFAEYSKKYKVVEEAKVPEFANLCKIASWDEPSPTVTGGVGPTNGALSVADPRLPKREGRYPGLYKVVPWEESCNTITGQSDIQTGALSVADPRISDKWSGAGNYGVMKWDEPSKTITSNSDVHAGTAAVADPRIPEPNGKGVFIIISRSGKWHRPITAYECAMLQGFPRSLKDGTPFDIIDCNEGKAREYIGNAVPVQTATAIGNSLLATMATNLQGDWYWGFADDKIWVLPENEHESEPNYMS